VRKGEPLSATERMERSRDARNDRIQEVVLLLSWLTQLADVNVHLSPIEAVSANATMNFVVCLHHGDKRLAWRVSDFEVMEYFKHLEAYSCPRGLSRNDKMAYMAQMATDGL
jgi:hypothetical protein